MGNPWCFLPEAQPFVLQADAAAVAAFNQKYAGTPYELHTELPPEPFSGRLDAPIVLLNLNPGYSEDDATIMLGDADFQQAMKNTREFVVHDYPFYHLNPGFKQGNKGYDYWADKFRKLFEVDFDLKKCANSFLLLQAYPYKSKEFKKMTLLPSFDFTRRILLSAMQRRALVVQLRSKKIWEEAVPELAAYPRRIECRNPRRPTLSPGNLGSEGWRILLSALDAG